MKTRKILPVFVVSLALLGTTAGLQLNAQNANEKAVQISSTLVSKLNTFFAGKVQLSSTFTFVNDAENNLPIRFVDQVDENNRVQYLYANLGEGEQLIVESYLTKDALGYAKQKYLTLENEVYDRELQDSNGKPVLYDDYFANPFRFIKKLTVDQYNKYFAYAENGTTFVLEANDYAYGLITNDFINFYTDYDTYIWDSASLEYYLDDFKITGTTDGDVTNISFIKVKKDKFGGLQTSYNIEVDGLEQLATLNPVQASMDTQYLEEFTSKLESFQEKLNIGNFTETFTFDFYVGTPYENQMIYSNYYSLDDTNEYPMMISDLALNAGEQGLTYTAATINYNNEYVQIGISPETEYIDVMNQNTYSSIEEIVPLMNTISGDFFTYSDGIYKFDISSFLHADFYFAVDILYAICGECDNAFTLLGIYQNNNDYVFDSLEITFDENGIPSGKLGFYYNNLPCFSTFSFSNVGTTDLTQIDTIKELYSFFLNY